MVLSSRLLGLQMQNKKLQNKAQIKKGPIPGSYAKTLISIRLCTCTCNIPRSQTKIYPNPNQTKKSFKFGSRNPNPFRMNIKCPTGRAVGGHTKRVRVSRFVSVPN